MNVMTVEQAKKVLEMLEDHQLYADIIDDKIYEVLGDNEFATSDLRKMVNFWSSVSFRSWLLKYGISYDCISYTKMIQARERRQILVTNVCNVDKVYFNDYSTGSSREGLFGRISLKFVTKTGDVHITNYHRDDTKHIIKDPIPVPWPINLGTMEDGMKIYIDSFDYREQLWGKINVRFEHPDGKGHVEQFEVKQPIALDSIEQYRMQMAGISAAAFGYCKDIDGICEEYITVSLKDVIGLYKKYEELYKKVHGE